MRIEVRVNGKRLDEIAADIKRQIQDGVNAAMTASVLKIGGDAVKNAPYKTGTLRRSITYAVRGDYPSIVGVVGSNVRYARIQDQGGYTGRGYKTFIRPKFYMTQAVEDNVEYVRDQFRKRILAGG